MATDGSDKPMSPAPKHGGPIARTPKWVLLGMFWLLQAAVLYHLQAFLYVSQGEVGTDEGGMIGVWPTLSQIADLAYRTDEFMFTMLGALAVLTAAQGLLLLPVRRPGFVVGKGKNLRTSLVVAGFAIGVLVLAFVATLAGLLEAYDLGWRGLERRAPGGVWTVAAVIVIAGWAIATPLLMRFCKRGPREGVLARLSTRLLAGTMVEVALLIPMDLLVRRKGVCYCWSGSYWGLTLCGAVGLIFAGPAILLPLLTKRRKAWYAGRCGVCAYDMRGHPDALRCPECGTGWRGAAASASGVKGG